MALPLALGFGIASGLEAIAGLYGAIFVGFFAAIFGGTPAQVSGPLGPMTVAWLTTMLMDFITVVRMVFASLFSGKRMTDLEPANLHILTNPTPSTPPLPKEARILEQANGKILFIHVDGPMSFGSAKTL